jgi:transcriptional regulator with XRE-family HTH domain
MIPVPAEEVGLRVGGTRVSMFHEPIESLEAQLGARVRRLRQHMGLSRAQLAEAMGVSWCDVRRFETAGRMDAATAWELSQALGVSVDALFDPSETPPRVPALVRH